MSQKKNWSNFGNGLLLSDARKDWWLLLFIPISCARVSDRHLSFPQVLQIFTESKLVAVYVEVKILSVKFLCWFGTFAYFGDGFIGHLHFSLTFSSTCHLLAHWICPVTTGICIKNSQIPKRLIMNRYEAVRVRKFQ